MQVEIADSLYEKYQQLVKEYHLAEDVPSRLQQLIEKGTPLMGRGRSRRSPYGLQNAGTAL